ncbi:hypothetical protein M406DRAFT_60514 [Cryphonectria parasitica EP155]|uniref:3'(2'),5'-bisphosphate nucleotidase n=1 Tax=Cryphonectria parasitica (strain ATCC 38755 / EP155) TaxID=660469 RepID=A0A9P5CP01_CRYP1|nr:uncharacterized protein M406DRAFT_60514 [Cryphonectria parasitica EP155]KAF3765994.1 hypothetical protein M406DRAFT_60514 [Cryphonectria parasitica EP155]
MDSPYTQELEVAIAAVQAAARLSSLDDLSPVTVGDFAIQALLTCTIHAAFPDDRFVGEESADALRANPALLHRVWTTLQQASSGAAAVVKIPDSPEQMCQMIDWCGTGRPDQAARIWVFDPIDGTENFVQGLVYAVNVALLHDGQQALSVVGCPNLSASVAYPASDDSLDPAGEGCILLAVRGHGAFIRGLHNPHLLSTTARNKSGLPTVHQEVAHRLGVEYPGSTLLPWVLRWVLLALGVGNSTWWVYKSRDRLAKIWDHAGAMLLFEEVGGKVSDVDGRDIDLTADRKMIENYGIVAAPAHLHASLLTTIQEVLREQRPDLATRPA